MKLTRGFFVVSFMMRSFFASSAANLEAYYKLKHKITLIVTTVKFALYESYYKNSETYCVSFRPKNLDDKDIQKVLSGLHDDIMEIAQNSQSKNGLLLSLCYERHPYMASILILACTASMLYSSYRLIKLNIKRSKGYFNKQ